MKGGQLRDGVDGKPAGAKMSHDFGQQVTAFNGVGPGLVGRGRFVSESLDVRSVGPLRQEFQVMETVENG